MAKARPVRTSSPKLKFDTMSVTVLLVMAIFGGIVGYYIGKSTGNGSELMLRDAANVMKQNGAEMRDVGQMMQDRGTRWGDPELKMKGEKVMQDGSDMTGKGDGMMGTTAGY